MNMFWRKLRPSASDPAQVKARLVRLFRDSKAEDMFTLDDLTDQIKADSKRNVAFVLSHLTSARQVDQVVQVVSPTIGGGGIKRFAEVSQVPHSLFDPFQLKDIDVEPRMIRIYFTKHNPNSIPTEDELVSSGEHRAIA
jgi:hypothetical protein